MSFIGSVAICLQSVQLNRCVIYEEMCNVMIGSDSLMTVLKYVISYEFLVVAKYFYAALWSRENKNYV